LVVGLPLKMDGSDNPVTGAARKFGNRLHERYNLPIYMVDERLTTREARSDLIDAGVPVRRHKPVLDRLAARSILQTFLSEHSESDLERAD
jgi:putative Holliday junction resolvase